jgi:hypothetical protein
MTRRRLFGTLLPAWTVVSAASEKGQREIRLVCVAPSPYTRRYDALRAGYGIIKLLKFHIQKQGLPMETSLYDGAKRLGSPAEVKSLFANRPSVLLIGSSTWGQGSNRFIRQLFELVSDVSLIGVRASCWVTSGGAHTGGEIVALDIQRSLQGLGASVFSLGQKLMVLTTDEREELAAGQFALLDVWFLDQFARMTILQAVDTDAEREKLRSALAFDVNYYQRFPLKSADYQTQVRETHRFLNDAAKPTSPERQEVMASTL